MSHLQPAHYGGLCDEQHFCPPCEDGTGECSDLFFHSICGLVACCSDEVEEAS